MIPTMRVSTCRDVEARIRLLIVNPASSATVGREASAACAD